MYRTADFGKLIRGGCIQYEGRTDSQIKIHGNRVEILEIERALRSIEQVENAVVLCYHAGKEDQALLAFVVLKNDDSEPTSQQVDIENILKTKLRDFEIPQVFIIESIPLLPNGKGDRQTLLKHYEDSGKKCKSLTAAGPPIFIIVVHVRNITNLLRIGDIEYDFTGIPDDRLQTAKEVFEIIGSVSKFTSRITISAQSNFYQLGGDSLNSVLTVSKLRDKGFCIGVTDFITAKCLGDVLDKICDEEMVEENLTKFKTIPLTMHHKHQVISYVSYIIPYFTYVKITRFSFQNNDNDFS